jgi:DNA-binding CsgD family transcriptional regulator/tetratricopeptide (TPR) repeat protein
LLTADYVLLHCALRSRQDSRLRLCDQKSAAEDRSLHQRGTAPALDTLRRRVLPKPSAFDQRVRTAYGDCKPPSQLVRRVLFGRRAGPHVVNWKGAMKTLLERDEPLAALSHALETSRARGQFFCVSGEAGIGKTSLLRALAAREGRTARFLWGACEALSTPAPLAPLFDVAAGLDGEFEALLASAAPRHHVFAAFVTQLAQHVPSVVVFEDVHWADEATLDLLRYVGRRMHRITALIVLTWRADQVGADHPLHRVLGDLPAGSCHRIELRPLSYAAVERLAGETHDAGAVFALTGGNPFFVTEVLRDGMSAVPASVRESILARRAVLPARTREVLDLVSVVPARTEIDVIRAHAPSADAVLPAMAAGLLTFDGRYLSFRHELARLAVLESLPLLRVQHLHRVVLDALTPLADRTGVLARLAHHAVAAGDAGAVQRFAPAAARHAVALGAHREAAAHYRTALAWADRADVAVRAELNDLLSYECYLTGDIAASQQARAEALGLWRQLSNTRAIGRDIRWLSRLAWYLGDRANAEQLAVEAIEVLTPLGEDEELAMALSNRAQLHMLAREHDRCFGLGERAIAIALRVGSVEVVCHALNNVGTSRLLAGDPSGPHIQQVSLALALEHDLHEQAARAFGNIVACSVQGRRYDEARRWLRVGINYCRERDLDSCRLYMLAWRARLLAETGDWAASETDALAVISDPRAPIVARIPALTSLGIIRARQRVPTAAKLLDEALALAERTCENQRLVPLRAARAERALLEGRPDTALVEARAGLARLTVGDPAWEWEILRYFEWRATGSADEGPPTATNGTMPGPHALQIRGDWQAAAGAWGRLGCPYERAEALADGDVPAKEKALQAFLGLGARAAVDRVRQELRRAGVRRLRRGPRRSTCAHPAGLTRRESEVLGLLAGRLTNPVIGERLFVSPKTVEHHVSAILLKLDVTTRDEAVVEARRRGWLDPTAAAAE